MKVVSILFALALVSATYQISLCPALKEVADDGLKVVASCIKSKLSLFPAAGQVVDVLEKKAEGVVNDGIGKLCGRRRRDLDIMGAVSGAISKVANAASAAKTMACSAGATAACAPVLSALEKALEAGLQAEGFPVPATSCIFDAIKDILVGKCKSLCRRRRLVRALKSDKGRKLSLWTDAKAEAVKLTGLAKAKFAAAKASALKAAKGLVGTAKKDALAEAAKLRDEAVDAAKHAKAAVLSAVKRAEAVGGKVAADAKKWAGAAESEAKKLWGQGVAELKKAGAWASKEAGKAKSWLAGEWKKAKSWF